MQRGRHVIPFSQLRMTDVEMVGGKNASLGEMLSQLTEEHIRVPDGFATTAEAFRLFLNESRLTERINSKLATLDVDDVKALAAAGRDLPILVQTSPPHNGRYEPSVSAALERLRNSGDPGRARRGARHRRRHHGPRRRAHHRDEQPLRALHARTLH